MTDIKAKTAPTRWEYYFHPKELANSHYSAYMDPGPHLGTENDVNDLGRSGWELVAVVPISKWEGATSKVVFIFKRPIG